jgi:hypothetical protein
MLRWILIAVVLIGLTAVATFLVQSGPSPTITENQAVNEARGPQPRAEVVGDVIFDFGDMSQESKSTHSWEVKNVGDATLELWQEGQTTCACTVSSLPKDGHVKVEPGSSFKIALDWQTKQFKNDFSQGATIGTSDPRLPTFKISVKGKVYPPVLIVPPEMIVLNGISNEETNRKRLFLFSKDRPQTKITNLSTSRPKLIVATQEPLTEADQTRLDSKTGARINIEIKPGMPLGQFQDELIIETDHPLQPLIKMTIAGKTTGPISVMPERLRLTSVNGTQGAQQDITLWVRGAKETKFEIEKKPERLKIEITPSDPATQTGRYKLRATVPPGTPPGVIDGDIVIKTDHPRAGELKIPVTILISNAVSG